MKKKIIGIFVCTLLIATAFPVFGSMEKINNSPLDILDYGSSNELVPGELIVKFIDDSVLSNPSIIALNEKNQVNSVEKVFKNAENTILENLYVLEVPIDSDIISIVHDYSSHPDVVYAEPCGIVYPCINDLGSMHVPSRDIANFDEIPNDKNFTYQWALHNTGQNIRPDPLPPIYGTFDADIDAPDAWDIETGDPDVIIAIIDSGIDYNHPDLAGNMWINDDEIPGNGIDDDSNGYIDDVSGWDFYEYDNDPLDDYGHGTHCAGIASAQTDNIIGIAGVSWNCKIMNIQIYNATGDILLIRYYNGMKYAADNGADVLSMSWGGYDYYQAAKDTVEYCYDKGVFLCAAAHNHNTSNKCYPAAFENVTAVGATNQHDERCDDDDWDPYNWYSTTLGSNYGDWVDVAAPGNLIYSTMPTYNYYYQHYLNPMRGPGRFYQNDYDYWFGTSMATPQVAGLAGLLISKNPYLSPNEVHAIICDESNVDPYISEEYIGTGRINAHKALISMFGDLQCDGSLSWVDVKPGETVTGNFTVENVGLNGSLLDWENQWLPKWGEWTLTPDSGENLSPKDGLFTVQVTCIAPDEKNKEFTGSIRIRNSENNSDYDEIPVSLTLPKNKPSIFNLPIPSWLFEHFPNAFPILRYKLGQ